MLIVNPYWNLLNPYRDLLPSGLAEFTCHSLPASLHFTHTAFFSVLGTYQAASHLHGCLTS